jgi:hypothetical protein
MWTPAEYIAAGALGLTALTVVLGYAERRHARSEGYRTALYSARIQAATELSRALAELENAMEWTEDDKEREESSTDLARSFIAAVAGWAPVLTADAFAAVTAQLTYLEGRMDLTQEERDQHPAGRGVFMPMRRMLGTEPLHDEIQKLLWPHRKNWPSRQVLTDDEPTTRHSQRAQRSRPEEDPGAH